MCMSTDASKYDVILFDKLHKPITLPTHKCKKKKANKLFK